MILDLSFQSNNPTISLREGIEDYHSYLSRLNRKILVDKRNDQLWLNHDATHVIFGLNTALEEEATLDIWVLFGCRYKLSELFRYSQLPEVKALSRDLIKELGWGALPRVYLNAAPAMFRAFVQTRRMIKKWPFELPINWLERPICELRKEHGIKILDCESRNTGRRINFGGI